MRFFWHFWIGCFLRHFRGFHGPKHRHRGRQVEQQNAVSNDEPDVWSLKMPKCQTTKGGQKKVRRRIQNSGQTGSHQQWRRGRTYEEQRKNTDIDTRAREQMKHRWEENRQKSKWKLNRDTRINFEHKTGYQLNWILGLSRGSDESNLMQIQIKIRMHAVIQ